MENGLNWREVWERKRKERVEGSLKGKLEPRDWDKIAKDYSEWNRSNDYEYGGKSCRLHQLLKSVYGMAGYSQ